jgi:glucose-6-phosphate isomerase
MSARMRLQLPPADQARISAVLEHAARDRWAERLFDRDPSVWSDDPAIQREMADRLGWLDAPAHFTDEIPALEGFGDGIRVEGFNTAVVMGMGGSSLAPEVLHRVFGTAEGYPDLRVLDSTDPAAVAAVLDELDPLQTLWIVASKSGTTTEPLAFLAASWARVHDALQRAGSDQRTGEFFAAITDPGRSLGAIPHHDEMRERFLNLADVGGRYSALTYVGLVPASLIGLDLDALLAAASTMLAECREPDPAANPGLLLGAAIGELARGGRDKLTLVGDDSLVPFNAWAEQLLAESTGKQGTGILPVDREPLGAPESYGPDRVFVDLALAAGTTDDDDGGGRDAGSDRARRARALDALVAAGQPVIRIELDDPMDLGGEFVRWEVATAIAGAVLGIDPFDQPNVEEAKERTRRLLAGTSPAGASDGSDRPGSDAPDESTELRVDALGEAALAEALSDSVRPLRPPNYLAIQAFIAPTPERDARIADIRERLRVTRCATTVGYGPRFLHSTGQLHKGGPASGWFLQLTGGHPADLPIPGWPYTFGRLIDAQAHGDREALRAHGRPVVHVALGEDVDAGLGILERAMDRALGKAHQPEPRGGS